MPDIKENDTHPSALSDAERERMNKLVEEDSGQLEDGENGDEEEDAGADHGEDGEQEAAAGADPKDDKPAAAEAAAEAGGGEGGEAAAGAEGAGKVETVSKQQFDGVLNELRDTRRVVQALRGPKLEPLPPRDFDAEDKALDDAEAALDKRLDEEMDFTDADYRAEMREINRKRREMDRDRGRYEMRAEQEQAATAANEVLQKAQQEEWDSMVADWQESLGDWLKNPARRNNVNATMAAMMQDPEDSKLDNAAFLAKLEDYLADEYATFPKREDAAPGTKVGSRRRIAAARAAEATGGPPRMQGGTGNRATPASQVDMKSMKLGQFGNLPKAVQDKALGLSDTD